MILKLRGKSGFYPTVIGELSVLGFVFCLTALEGYSRLDFRL